MYVEIEFSFQVVGTEFAKAVKERGISAELRSNGQRTAGKKSGLLGFVPGHYI